MEKATFGAGCFWGVQAAFDRIPGVVETAVGYEGGRLENPSYHDVCTDRTGHAEVLQITFDPARVTYQHLLDAFFAEHNPTQLNRQGPDHGTQYRSVIFYHSRISSRPRPRPSLDSRQNTNSPNPLSPRSFLRRHSGQRRSTTKNIWKSVAQLAATSNNWRARLRPERGLQSVSRCTLSHSSGDSAEAAAIPLYLQ